MNFLESKWPGNLFYNTENRHSYYIVAPAYTRKSAGIRVLHMLCNALNQSGYPSYIIIHPQFNFDSPISSFLKTPLLTKKKILDDFENGVTPIVVYPEVIGQNLFDAPVAFEYLLNFKGLLGGPKAVHSMTQIAYSEQIRRKSPNAILNLFIPTSDPQVFHKPELKRERNGTYYYAAKLQAMYGKLENLPERNMREILRNGNSVKNIEDLVHIYQTARRIYVYENTAVATEAAMCGCPVIFMPNQFLSSNITEYELSTCGMAWGNESNEISRAENTVDRFYENYLKSFFLARDQLEKFIEISQSIASNTTYKKVINVPHINLVDQWMRLFSNTFGLGERIIYSLSSAIRNPRHKK
jgi:hypothetical protein